MTEVLGWRRKFGVIGPSTNTVVQPDFDDMRPPGVTNHYSRIFTPNADAVSNDSFRAARQIESISTSSCSEFSRTKSLLVDGEPVGRYRNLMMICEGAGDDVAVAQSE